MSRATFAAAWLARQKRTGPWPPRELRQCQLALTETERQRDELQRERDLIVAARDRAVEQRDRALVTGVVPGTLTKAAGYQREWYGGAQ